MKKPRHKNFSLITWLCKFSGEDYQLIHDARTAVNVRGRFAFIGSLVLIIFCVAMYSCAHFIYELFNHNIWVAVTIGLLWGFTITNLYLLLLYTITPPMLKGKERAVRGIGRKETTENQILSNFSMGFRIAFVVLLGVIIAQPWLVSSFSGKVGGYLEASKQQYRNSFIIQADSILITEEQIVEKDMMKEVALIGKSSTDSMVIAREGAALFNKISEDWQFLTQASLLLKEIDKEKQALKLGRQRRIDSINTALTLLVKNEQRNDSLFVAESKPPVSTNPYLNKILEASHGRLMTIINQKKEQYSQLDTVLRASNFYIRKIQLINSRFPLAWIMTVAVMFLFVIPILAKYRMRNKTNFYIIKKELENTIVLEEYVGFKHCYEAVFLTRFGEKIQFYESCTDPPFNTIKKKATLNTTGQEELLQQVYGSDEVGDAQKYFVREYIGKK